MRRGCVLSQKKRGEQPGLIFLVAIAASVLALGHLRVWWCKQLKSGDWFQSRRQFLFLFHKTYFLFLTGLTGHVLEIPL